MTGTEIRYDREALVQVLIYHQRRDIGTCYCGWGVLGASHAEHVADIYEMVVTGDPGNREGSP